MLSPVGKSSESVGGIRVGIARDATLIELCEGSQVIEPWDLSVIQPASIDLRLGRKFRVPVEHGTTHIDLADVEDSDMVEVDNSRFVLHPGEFALGVTHEIIRVPTDMVGRMEGKSSLGRVGLIVHVTAGFFDPGFVGHGTLEFVNLRRVPIVLREGVRICQFSFQWMDGEAVQPYRGRYQGDDGPSASRYGRGGE